MNHKGFTLIEVLIGVTIIAGMSLLIQATTSRVLTSKQKVERRDEVTSGAEIALAKIADDFSQSFLAGTNLKGANAAFNAGMKGSVDHIDFTTFSHYHYQADAKDTDSVSIGYSLLSGKGRTQDLVRRESQRLSDKIDKGGKTYPLLSNVKEFKLQYYDSNKEEWVPEWDSTQISVLGRLPEAIKIKLTVAEMEDEEEVREHVFETTVSLPLYKNEINF